MAREYRTKIKDCIVSIFLCGDNCNIVFVPGLPQSIDKHHPLVRQAERLGCNLFIPQYPGTHDSGGKLSVAGASEIVAETIKLAKSGQAAELYGGEMLKWNTGRVCAMGFSFGALPLLMQNQHVHKTMLVCPFVSMKFHNEKRKDAENILETFDFLEKAYPWSYRFEKQALARELKEVKLPKRSDEIILIYSMSDQVIPQEEIAFIKDLYKCKAFEKADGHSAIMADDMLEKILVG